MIPNGFEYQIDGVRLPLGEPFEQLKRLAGERLSCGVEDLLTIEVLKRSLDARRHRHPTWVMDLRVELPLELQVLPRMTRPYVPPLMVPLPVPPPDLERETIAIIGSGPCGLFAALTLAERGVPSLIFERGEAVDQRARSLGRLLSRCELNPESNYCFGEGGGGTFSDGKLYTRVHEPDVGRVMDTLVRLGAPPDIRVDRRPHLGTDRLIGLLGNIRRYLVEQGVRFHFGARVDSIERAGRRGVVVLADGTRIEADRVILASGSSSRDLLVRLRGLGVAMEAKAFAVGFRVEHPQSLIDEIQYGRHAHTLEVPAAEYHLAYHAQKGKGLARGSVSPDIKVYSFCMCPGGRVVPTATREGQVCLNGMSGSARSGKRANAAIVTAVTPDELRGEGRDPALVGIEFQERIERRAYELGGGHFAAPASRLVDFMNDRSSRVPPKTTYACGVNPEKLSRCYPGPIVERLRAGLAEFGRKMHGFLSEEAVLLGVETRTSSPVRLLRDDNCRSSSHSFLYPGGEGAGHAGGIVSSAVDGVAIARAILGGE